MKPYITVTYKHLPDTGKAASRLKPVVSNSPCPIKMRLCLEDKSVTNKEAMEYYYY